MKCFEIMELLETLAPGRLACGWDNPGLLAGRREKEVSKVLLTLDVDDRTAARAVSCGADMIISHHPLIFKAIKRVTDEDFIGRRLLTLIRADIAYFAMHTNFDAAPEGMAEAVVKRLGLMDCEPLEVMGEENGLSYGIGRIGALRPPMTGPAFARRVKEAFGLPFVTAYGSRLWENEPVSRVAVCPGSGGSVVGEAIGRGAQVLVTGDIGHHAGIDAAAQGLMILDAGHYGLEHVFMEDMERWLGEHLPEKIVIEKMPVEFPEAVI
ncbi:MAG: Nif3-like dinuclear metal center hexameric protein [Lachnospiraceae bacterium]|jgi:dinuclear metal center YbgI/SA1388 family protein|nr:Nif3-like dinuclear metal center hexameric protein [Lachnospiraceae bacterium]